MLLHHLLHRFHFSIFETMRWWGTGRQTGRQDRTRTGQGDRFQNLFLGIFCICSFHSFILIHCSCSFRFLTYTFMTYRNPHLASLKPSHTFHPSYLNHMQFSFSILLFCFKISFSFGTGQVCFSFSAFSLLLFLQFWFLLLNTCPF